MSDSRSTIQIHAALTKHAARFCDENNDFTPTTVTNGLDIIHSSKTKIKGVAIATFNATHASSNVVCPVTHAHFAPDAATGYAKNLHMGTTRIWNADGSVNEARWKKFADFVTSGQAANEEKIVPYSRLKAYLADCYQNDPQELTTGRNTQPFFSSKYVQGSAATAAWDEVYDRLTCGWKQVDEKNKELEPYITLALVREFFEDSTLALQKAQDGILPVAKPVASITPAFAS